MVKCIFAALSSLSLSLSCNGMCVYKLKINGSRRRKAVGSGSRKVLSFVVAVVVVAEEKRREEQEHGLGG